MKMLSELECSLQAFMKQDQSIENEERACCRPNALGPMQHFQVSVFIVRDLGSFSSFLISLPLPAVSIEPISISFCTPYFITISKTSHMGLLMCCLEANEFRNFKQRS